METLSTANGTAIPRNSVQDRQKKVRLYSSSIAVVGFSISLYAIHQMQADLTGMLVFILMAAVVELASVELFQNSRSQVSMASVIAIASIVTFGPLAGVITYLSSGLTTAIKIGAEKRNSEKPRVPLIQRTGFNVGMLALAGFSAGWIYSLFGGTTGNLAQMSDIFALAMAASIEWLVNAGILIGVISLQTGQRPVEVWKRDIRWQAPVSIAGGILGSGFLALAYGMFGIWGTLIVLLPILSTSYAFRTYKNNMQVYVEDLENLNKKLKGTLSALEKSNTELTAANQSVMRLNAELFHSLAKVFDMRDPYVGGHAAQVATYAVAIAAEMGLPSERIEAIRQSAYLHDIGKLAIPEAILHKPGKLTDIEYAFIKKHTDIGADLLASTDGLKHLAPFVRHHHERWDGRGYPLGLAGEEISLEARILNVSDAVESMASDRPYHRGMSVKEILAELQHCADSQFDPQIVRVFVDVVKKKGELFVENSARSVTQQYAASLLTNESLTHSMFAWVLEKEAQRQKGVMNTR